MGLTDYSICKCKYFRHASYSKPPRGPAITLAFYLFLFPTFANAEGMLGSDPLDTGFILGISLNYEWLQTTTAGPVICCDRRDEWLGHGISAGAHVSAQISRWFRADLGFSSGYIFKIDHAKEILTYEPNLYFARGYLSPMLTVQIPSFPLNLCLGPVVELTSIRGEISVKSGSTIGNIETASESYLFGFGGRILLEWRFPQSWILGIQTNYLVDFVETLGSVSLNLGYHFPVM